jgi:tol-pal system protein YbgF
MTIFLLRTLAPAALLLAGLTAAHAQVGAPTSPGAVNERLDSLERDTSGFFGRLFGRGDRSDRGDPVEREDAPVVQAQMSPSDLIVRLDRLENHVRQLTGLVEQLQYRNQQLEQQLRRMEETGYQDQGGRPAGRPPARPQASPQVVQPPPPGPPMQPQRRSDVFEPAESPAAAPQLGPPRSAQRRGDVFDPNENPDAPGAPRVLGALPSGPTVIRGAPDDDAEAPPIGAPGGRRPGAPLDLSTLSERAANDLTLGGPSSPPTGALPPPPPRMPSATGAPQQHAMLPPAATPKDEYDLAYGHLLRKDYALAEENFRGFVRKYPNDRLVAEANYWLGESLFQRQRYRDAAESFLTVSTKYEKSAKAPDSLLRLGQSLAALREKEAACATFVEIGRKYPRASPSVKQGVEREQKRVGC